VDQQKKMNKIYVTFSLLVTGVSISAPLSIYIMPANLQPKTVLISFFISEVSNFWTHAIYIFIGATIFIQMASISFYCFTCIVAIGCLQSWLEDTK